MRAKRSKLKQIQAPEQKSSNRHQKEDKMENSNQINRRQTRTGSVKYNPSHDDVSAALEEFLNKGGKIDKLEPDEKTFKNSLLAVDVSSDVDEFLLGQ